MSTALPLTAVIIPALNEEHYIIDCLRSLLDDLPGWVIQIVVVDGGSVDGTVELVEEFAELHPIVSVMHNPRQLQSAAVNLAARQVNPEVRVLVRADAHASYPPGFISTCVAALVRHDTASVVVPIHTVGATGLQRAIAYAQNSRLGNGGSAHRIGDGGRLVEHGHHAAFDRAIFLALGGYDETFSHNEDAEFDYRLTCDGGRIWMTEQAIVYYPRRTLWSLARQYLRNGAGRAKTIRLHRMRPRVRQVMPLFILLCCIFGLVMMPESPWFGLLPLGYLLTCISWGAVIASRTRDPWMLAIGPSAMTMHMAWAIGFARCWLGWPPAISSPMKHVSRHIQPLA